MECPTQLSNDKAAKLQKVSERPVIGLSANMQHEMHIEQPPIGLTANMQTVAGHTLNMQKALSSAQPIIGLSADGLIKANTRTVWSPIEANGHRASSKDSTASIDKICEENIRLFSRCEEHRNKQTELKQMIENMEKELAETKRKCLRISSHLKNQKRPRQHTGKAL